MEGEKKYENTAESMLQKNGNKQDLGKCQ